VEADLGQQNIGLASAWRKAAIREDWRCILELYGHLGDKPSGRQTNGRQSNWATAKWATHFGQLGDNIGRVPQDAYVGRNVRK